MANVPEKEYDKCMDYLHVYSSVLGKITIASDGEALIGLWLEGNRFIEETVSEEWKFEDDLSVFRKSDQWLNIYFSGMQPDFTPPFLVRGSAFRKKVCHLLLKIPYGETRTYGEIARMISEETGKKMSAQAVGGAVGHNPISIMIPCHRVIGAGGKLTGYGGGIDKKVWLLKHEGVDISCLTFQNRKADDLLYGKQGFETEFI